MLGASRFEKIIKCRRVFYNCLKHPMRLFSFHSTLGSIKASSRFYSFTRNERSEKKKGNRSVLLTLGVLALGSTLLSIGIRKTRSPKEMLEMTEEQKKAKNTKIDLKDFSVVFILGGPGSGKGTQCTRIAKDFGFAHVCAGDLLRKEQDNPDSKYGNLIKHSIKEGLILPHEITISLLKTAIEKAYLEGRKNMVVDGFPRKMDQAIIFEKEIAPCKLVLFFECSESIMLERLLDRSKTSGRTDDNVESIQKRFKTFIDTTIPVVKYFEEQNKVVKVRSDQPVEEVYKTVVDVLKERVLSD